MARRTNIIKGYYQHYAWQKESWKERFNKFCVRHNLFGKYNKDIDCLELADKILKDFSPSKTIDGDPFLCRARQALVNAVVFFLYCEHVPNDFDFTRVNNMLLNAKELTLIGIKETHLDYMYEGGENKSSKHTGMREYEVFKQTSVEGACLVVEDILKNFKVLVDSQGNEQSFATGNEE